MFTCLNSSHLPCHSVQTTANETVEVHGILSEASAADPSLEIRRRLLQRYDPGPQPTLPPRNTPYNLAQSLTEAESFSIAHYRAWRASGGTSASYIAHMQLLQKALQMRDPSIHIGSLHNVKQLVSNLTGMVPKKISMCTNSCIAFTNSYADLDQCPYRRQGRGAVCGRSRFQRSNDHLSSDLKSVMCSKHSIYI